MKKLTALTLCLSLICICLSNICVKAEETYTEGYYTYTVTDGKATITACDPEISGDITVPTTLGGYEVEKIGDKAFYACTKLTGVTIENIEIIGKSAFVSCLKLTKVTIGDGVNIIGSGAFNGNNKTTEISLSNTVTTIGDYAFNQCSMTEITIPESVESIGECAFQACYSLKNLTVCDGVRYYGKDAFWGCSIENVYITSLPDWCQSSFFGTVSTPFKTNTKLYVDGVQLTNAIIPDTCPVVNAFAFCGLKTLTSVELGTGLKEIGKYAFAFTDLRTVTFRSFNLQSVGMEAFMDCNYLSTVNIYNIKNWCKIWFESMDSNPITKARTVTIDGNPLPYTLEIPNGTQIINRASLTGIKVGAIIIPKSVTKIGMYAFTDSSIANTYYLGTRSDFAQMTGNVYVQGTIHYKAELGDLNNDGLFNSTDLSLLRIALMNGTSPDACDVHLDGFFNVKDLVALKKIIVNL